MLLLLIVAINFGFYLLGGSFPKKSLSFPLQRFWIAIALILWARMIQCGNHKDYDDPPRVPHITGILPKRPKKETLTDVIAGAAVAITKVATVSTTSKDTPN